MSRTPARITQADVARALRAETFIYFLRAGEFVKIGQSKNWKQRIDQMQVGSPYTIVPLLVILGDPCLEKALHARFRNAHFRGEWFHVGPTISAYVKENLDKCVVKSGLSTLPERQIIL